MYRVLEALLLMSRSSLLSNNNSNAKPAAANFYQVDLMGPCVPVIIKVKVPGCLSLSQKLGE